MNAVTEEGVVVTKPCLYHKANFETLKRAFANGDIALMEVQLAATGEIVAAIVATLPKYNRLMPDLEELVFVPFAVMLNGDPYQLLNPPNPDGGFVSQKEQWKGDKP